MEAKRIWTRPGNGRLRHFVFVRFLASTNCQRIGPGGEFSLFYHLFITVHWLLLLWKDIEVNLAIIIVSLKQFLLYSQKSKQRWFCLYFFFFFNFCLAWEKRKTQPSTYDNLSAAPSLLHEVMRFKTYKQRWHVSANTTEVKKYTN